MHTFFDSECLPDAEDGQKCFLYGLQNSQLLVPIVSIAGWESILNCGLVVYFFFYFEELKTADTSADNVLKEYEHFLNMINSVRYYYLFLSNLINLFVVGKASENTAVVHWSQAKSK